MPLKKIKCDNAVSSVEIYFEEQYHFSLKDFINSCNLKLSYGGLIQVTTLSRISKLENENYGETSLHSEFYKLTQIDSQRALIEILSNFFLNSTKNTATCHYLFLSCENAHENQELINCTKICIEEEYEKKISNNNNYEREKHKVFVYLLLHIPRINVRNFTSVSVSKWFNYHIDEFTNDTILPVYPSYEQTLCDYLNYIDPLQLKRVVQDLSVFAYSKLSNGEQSDRKRHEFIKSCFDLKKFEDIFMQHVLRFEKEFQRKFWMNEASTITNVVQTGSLIRSCANMFQKRLENVFMIIISIIDAANNLDLLHSQSDYIKKLWYAFFSNNKILHLNYQNFNLKTYYPHDSISYLSQANFKFKLPFSRIIKYHIDSLIKSKREITELNQDANEEYGQLKEMFKKTDLYQLIIDANIDSSFVGNYLNDYLLLSTSNNFVDVAHFELFAMLINEEIIKYDHSQMTDVSLIILIHLVYEKFENEIYLLDKIISCCSNMDSLKANMLREMNIKFKEIKSNPLINSAKIILAHIKNNVYQNMSSTHNSALLKLVERLIDILWLHKSNEINRKEINLLLIQLSIFKSFIQNFSGYKDSLENIEYNGEKSIKLFFDEAELKGNGINDKNQLNEFLNCYMLFVIGIFKCFWLNGCNKKLFEIDAAFNDLLTYFLNRKTINIFSDGVTLVAKTMFLQTCYEIDSDCIEKILIGLYSNRTCLHSNNNDELNFRVVLINIYEKYISSHKYIDFKEDSSNAVKHSDLSSIIVDIKKVAKLRNLISQLVGILNVYDINNHEHKKILNAVLSCVPSSADNYPKHYFIRQTVKLYGISGLDIFKNLNKIHGGQNVFLNLNNLDVKPVKIIYIKKMCIT